MGIKPYKQAKKEFLKEPLKLFHNRYLPDLLEKCDTIDQSAKMAGITKATLYSLLRKYGKKAKNKTNNWLFTNEVGNA